VAVGVNRVQPLSNSALHAEVTALMLAEAAVGSFTLRDPPHALFTSCAPCAMCLGASLWSGVRRVVYGATRDDAAALGFDEGPVFDASYAYLEARGVRVVHGLLRAEAGAAFDAYRAAGGAIYNG
jgi:tRNA(Arg) A34 adenosine deaminase TadA